jgi:hypothetical protein
MASVRSYVDANSEQVEALPHNRSTNPKSKTRSSNISSKEKASGAQPARKLEDQNRSHHRRYSSGSYVDLGFDIQGRKIPTVLSEDGPEKHSTEILLDRSGHRLAERSRHPNLINRAGSSKLKIAVKQLPLIFVRPKNGEPFDPLCKAECSSDSDEIASFASGEARREASRPSTPVCLLQPSWKEERRGGGTHGMSKAQSRSTKAPKRTPATLSENETPAGTQHQEWTSSAPKDRKVHHKSNLKTSKTSNMKDKKTKEKGAQGKKQERLPIDKLARCAWIFSS